MARRPYRGDPTAAFVLGLALVAGPCPLVRAQAAREDAPGDADAREADAKDVEANEAGPDEAGADDIGSNDVDVHERGAFDVATSEIDAAETGDDDPGARDATAAAEIGSDEPAADDREGQAAEPCPRPVWLTRAFPGGRAERVRLVLLDCDRRPRPEALDALSLLARPDEVPRPDEHALADHRARAADDAEAARFVAPDVLRLDAGLLPRLQHLADRFPGRRLVIVSGHRPDARRTSRHHHGRALDVRVPGVPRLEVARAARELPDTGVGFYPNSVFTHVDVRHRSAAWTDHSGPGEPPDYAPFPDATMLAAADEPRLADGRHEDTGHDDAPPDDPPPLTRAALDALLASIRAKASATPTTP